MIGAQREAYLTFSSLQGVSVMKAIFPEEFSIYIKKKFQTVTFKSLTSYCETFFLHSFLILHCVKYINGFWFWTGSEICCSVTTGNNLCADDAGLRGCTPSSVHLKHHPARPCNVLQRGHTRPDTWRVSFTLHINKSEDYVLHNNVSMFFSPLAPAYTHAHTHRMKSQKSVTLPPDDNVRAERFLPSTHPA